MAVQLKEMRKRMELTQQQVANALGITRQAYNHYETGRRKPDANMLRALADVFGCTVDAILGYAPHKAQEGRDLVPILRGQGGPLEEWETEGFRRMDVERPEEYFLLRVVDDSMEPAIWAGDLALVHRQEDVETNGLAVVLLEGEGSVRRVVKLDRGVALLAFKARCVPQLLQGRELDRMRIVGKVVRTLRDW